MLKIPDDKKSVRKLDELVNVYLELDRHIEQIKKEYRKKIAPLNDHQEKLTGRILNFLDRTGQKSARTIDGTLVTSVVSRKAQLDEPDDFMAFVAQHQLFELLDRHANTKACCEFAEEHGRLPPGVKINSIRRLKVTP